MQLYKVNVLLKRFVEVPIIPISKSKVSINHFELENDVNKKVIIAKID